MIQSTEKLRRAAKTLARAFEAGDSKALARVRQVLPGAKTLNHAGALHVIAREQDFDSWPKLKFAVEASTLDRAARAERLKVALYHGQHWVVRALLRETPDLGRDNIGLACALYDIAHVRAVLARDPAAATRIVGVRSPILHLAFSQHVHGDGAARDMLAVAEALAAAGADVNDAYPAEPGSPNMLSALYGALGHAGNLVLAEWLLQRGADPNDGESLYHSTELGHRDGLRLLLAHGARPEGTNALPRALDFNDHAAVEMLLHAGADPNEGIAPHPSGEPSWVIPALHQAARRMCDARMIRLLLKGGADPSVRYQGMTPYALARVYGNPDAARLIAEAGGETALSAEEALLAMAADGQVPDGRYLDPARLTDEYRNLIRSLIHMPDRLDHIRRLVALGAEYDRPDAMGVTPVQVAGWEGLPELMGYFLSLKPDLGHVNGYGGTLLGTIVHGSENCPARAERDHVACARLALVEGVALPKRTIEYAGEPGMAGFLSDWARAHPGQVVDKGGG